MNGTGANRRKKQNTVCKRAGRKTNSMVPGYVKLFVAERNILVKRILSMMVVMALIGLPAKKGR
jgi:hypothetical protein